MILRRTILITAGFWSNHIESFSLTNVSTIFLTSEETNLSFVCDENFGSGILTDRIAVKPSFMSSPDIESLFFFKILLSFTYLLITLVNALLKPNK